MVNIIMMKTKIRRILSPPRILAAATLVLLVMLSLSVSLAAQGAFIQGYGSDQPLQRGMIIQIKKEDSSKVEPVSMETMDQMHGVIVDANDAHATLSAEGEKVFVATGGRYDVLVNSQNGDIETGDYLTISSVNGIGMKAGTEEPMVVGRALSSFNGRENVVSTVTAQNSLGEDQTLNIGRVSADIVVARNPNLKATEPNLPDFLRKATEAIAGKPISAARAYVSVVIFVLSTIIAGILMYGGIRSAITSIGRNPLSKKSIVKGMLQVTLTGLIIFITGLFGVYLILKL